MYLLTHQFRPRGLQPWIQIPESPDPAVYEREIKNGTRPFPDPLIFTAPEPGELYDLLDTVDIFTLCSERFRRTIEDAGLTGVNFIDASIIMMDGTTLKDYSVIQVVGKTGVHLKVKRSGIWPVGMDLDMTRHDGSDFFRAEGYMYRDYVSEAARRVLKSGRFTNLHLIPIEKLDFPDSLL